MKSLARLVVIGSFPLVSLSAGCSDQSEGQRCDLQSDCQSDLVCTNLNGTLPMHICCPLPPAQSSVPSCNPGLSPVDAGAAVDASETDASSEARPDQGAADGAAEASLEAATDGASQEADGSAADAGGE